VQPSLTPDTKVVLYSNYFFNWQWKKYLIRSVFYFFSYFVNYFVKSEKHSVTFWPNLTYIYLWDQLGWELKPRPRPYHNCVNKSYGMRKLSQWNIKICLKLFAVISVSGECIDFWCCYGNLPMSATVFVYFHL
jgi:hypothetical protein